jgi:hypothetical protein
LDRFERYYVWFLLFISAAPAVLRLAQTRQVAELVSERMQDEKRRARSRKLGWWSAGASCVLLPVYLFYSRQAWLPMAFVVGVLTGVEMAGNARDPESASLVRQNRIFGWLYAVTAAGIVVWLIRK